MLATQPLPPITDQILENLLGILYRGTYAKREDIRDKIHHVAVGRSYTEAEVEEYVDRVRLYQEQFRKQMESGLLGSRPKFTGLPQTDSVEAKVWLEADKALTSY